VRRDDDGRTRRNQLAKSLFCVRRTAVRLR
jgi:hypothetical protein